MTDSVVVDASLALKWVLVEPRSSEAVAILEEWHRQGTRMIAPHLFAFEVANSVFKRVVRRELELDAAKERLEALLGMGPELDSDRSLHTRALELAHEFGLPTAYDAHYLALAEREGCACWTADDRLWNAARGRLPWLRWLGEQPASSRP